jgi:hypothetical protein
MKTMGWCSVTVAVGLLAGCASQPAGNNSANLSPNGPSTTMNASFSSDSSGVTDQDMAQSSEAYLAPVQLTLDQLPPAAQATIRQQAGQRRIVKIKRETRDGQAVYKVELTRQGDLFHGMLLVSADGSLLKEAHLSEPAGSEAPLPNMPNEGNPIERVPNGPNPAHP